jgi:hypothetical protein
MQPPSQVQYKLVVITDAIRWSSPCIYAPTCLRDWGRIVGAVDHNHWKGLAEPPARAGHNHRNRWVALLDYTQCLFKSYSLKKLTVGGGMEPIGYLMLGTVIAIAVIGVSGYLIVKRIERVNRP